MMPCTSSRLGSATNTPTDRSDTRSTGERKRRRKVLTCHPCRRRKLQCDRAVPTCGRCANAGLADTCSYIDDTTDTLRHTPEPREYNAVHFGAECDRVPSCESSTHAAPDVAQGCTLISRIESQERRTKKLEIAVARLEQDEAHNAKHQTPSETLEPITASDSTDMVAGVTSRATLLLQGNSFKIQFWGLSYYGFLTALIPDLRAFTKDTVEKFPTLARIKGDLQALENRTSYADSIHRSATDEDLKDLLPSKPESDELVQLYFDNYGSIYHIIHLPSFWQEYNRMWNALPQARPHFVALVLLMIAIAQCLRSAEPWLYVANSSSARERALALVQACEGWLQMQSQKHVTVIDFQLRFLINLARLVNGSKVKRTWTNAGSFLRFCMAAGLHRDPELVRKSANVALDMELWRRIWSAAVEFELQAALSRGMVSASWPQQSDCTPPSNIHDNVMDQDSNHLPAPRPLHEFTNASYLAVANKTLLLRHTLNTLVNDIRRTFSFDEVKRYTEEIEACLADAPDWIEIKAKIPQALLSITLRQYLLVLHDRFIRQASSKLERNFSQMVLIDTATRIVGIHKSLMDNGCRALQYLCQDQVRAALSVCQVSLMCDPRNDGVINHMVEKNAILVSTEVVELTIDKITRLGREQRQLWIVLAACALIKTKRDPTQKLVFIREAVDMIIRVYYKIMASQENVRSGITPGNGYANLGDGAIEDGLLMAGQRSSGRNAVHEPSLQDLEAIAAWTLDDWSFGPGNFEQYGRTY